MPLLAVIANKSLWPLWALISLGGTIFPFLPVPVYINFISRMQLAWSLDRQMPEWFGEVNERLHAPLNAILATIALTALFLFFQSFKSLPTIFATTDHKLNLAGTAWFSIMMAALHLAASRRQRDARAMAAARSDPERSLQAGIAVDRTRVDRVRCGSTSSRSSNRSSRRSAGGGTLTYLETNGILDAALFYALGSGDLCRHARAGVACGRR